MHNGSEGVLRPNTGGASADRIAAAQPAYSPTVTVQCDKYRVGHPAPPNEAADTEGVWPMTLTAALNHRFTTDAHVQAAVNVAETQPRRWTKQSYPLRIATLWIDVDAPGHAATAEWIADTFARLCAVMAERSGCLYQTRNGFRVVWALPAPFDIRDAAGDAAWKAQYAGVVAWFAARGIAIDASCSDVVRQFRLPFVVRDGVTQHLGKLYWNGLLWDAVPADADLTWRGALPAPVYRAEPDRAPSDIPVTEWTRLWALLAEPLSHYPAGSAPNRNAVGLALSHLAEAAGVDLDAWAADVGAVWPEYPPAVVRTWWQDGTTGYGVGTIYRALHAVARLGVIVPFDALRALLPGDAIEPDEIVELGAADCAALLDTATVDRFAAIKRADAVAYERAVAELRKTADATSRATIARFGVLVNARAKELTARKPADADTYSIIAFDSKAWVKVSADPSDLTYHKPQKRSNLLAWLRSVGRTDLIVGDDTRTWNENVTVAADCIRDFGQRATARYAPDTRTIHTGCPLPEIPPVYDADVDAWLRAMFGDGYGAAAQWIAVCTPERAHQLAAALVIVGPTSIGKSFFFKCLAQLWGATGSVKLEYVFTDFNASAETCPIWVDDEAAAIASGKITSQAFLELMQCTKHSIQRKNVERTDCYGAPRLGVPINTLRQLRFADTPGVDAIEAMAGRLSVHVVVKGSDRERAALDALNRLRLPGNDLVDVPRVLRHLRWVQSTTEVPATRFVGTWGADHTQQIALASVMARQPEVFEVLRAALAETLADRSKAPAWLCLSPDGTVCVHTTGLLAAVPRDGRFVSLRDVREALGAVCGEGADRHVTCRPAAGVRWDGWRIAPGFLAALSA